jgi:hypothetical protein
MAGTAGAQSKLDHMDGTPRSGQPTPDDFVKTATGGHRTRSEGHIKPMIALNVVNRMFKPYR